MDTSASARNKQRKKPAGCGILGLFGMASRDLLCI